MSAHVAVPREPRAVAMVPIVGWTASVRQAWEPLAVGATVVAATVLLRLRDPHVPGSYGLCPTRAVTGLDCPLCGGLRATNSLARGDVAAALDHNLLFTALVPLLVATWVAWASTRARLLVVPSGVRRRLARPALLLVGVAALVFTVVRNLPGFELLGSDA